MSANTSVNSGHTNSSKKHKLKSTLLVQEMLKDEINTKPIEKEEKIVKTKGDVKLPIKKDNNKKKPENKQIKKKDIYKSEYAPKNDKKLSEKQQETTSIKSDLLKKKLEEQKALLDKNRTYDSINKIISGDISYSLITNNNIDVSKINEMFD